MNIMSTRWPFKTLIKRIKKFVKKNQISNKLYNWLSFLSKIPIEDFLQPRKIKLIFSAKSYTMLSYQRLNNLYKIASQLERKKVDGNFVECGVWNGGSAAIFSTIARNNEDRYVWLFDSWEGLPEPKKRDISYKGEIAKRGMCLGYEKKVRELIFKKLKLNNKKIHLIKGWFSFTLPIYKKDIGEIALLHLDCDLYESVRVCLEELYKNVAKGGFIVIDDYGHWKGCKKAVDEFFKRNRLKIKLFKIDHTGVYFQK